MHNQPTRESEKESLVVLVERANSGDRRAWDDIVDRMNNLVWSVVRSFRFGEADAVDAAQMTWLRAVENLHKVHDPERLGLWLSTTARRECLRLIERRNRVVPVDLSETERSFMPDTSADVEKITIDSDEVARVFSALNTLSADCQALLRLVLSDPAPSYEEISAGLGIAVGTIGPRRIRCLQKLRAACNSM